MFIWLRKSRKAPEISVNVVAVKEVHATCVQIADIAILAKVRYVQIAIVVKETNDEV